MTEQTQSGPEPTIRTIILPFSYNMAAAVIGVSVDIFQDLIDYEDEIWILTISQFLRYCLVKNQPPSELWPLNRDTGESSFAVQDVNTLRQDKMVADWLREKVNEIPNATDEIGWEVEAITAWLETDFTMGEMLMTALEDVCTCLQVSPLDVIMSLWRSLRPPEAVIG